MSPRHNFQATAIKSKLVTEEQVRDAINLIVNSRGGDPRIATEIDDRALATKLVEMKILSTYQADQLMTGRWKLNLGPYIITCLLYTSPSPRDQRGSRMPSSA